jgi:hypothetical protein
VLLRRGVGVVDLDVHAIRAPHAHARASGVRLQRDFEVLLFLVERESLGLSIRASHASTSSSSEPHFYGLGADRKSGLDWDAMVMELM